jgi:hypothetical protein
MMLKKGEPPPRDSISDYILTKAFMMDQAYEYEKMYTMGILLAATSSSSNSTIINNVRSIMDDYKESIGYRRWSVASMREKEQKVRSDQETLKMVEKLGDMYRGGN